MKTLPVRRGVPVVIALLAGLAGGRFLPRPESVKPVVIAAVPAVSVDQKSFPGRGEPLRHAWSIASSGEAGSGFAPVPFEALDELVELVAGFDLFDEASGVELMIALPRLFMTGLPTVRRLLDELGGATALPQDSREMI